MWRRFLTVLCVLLILSGLAVGVSRMAIDRASDGRTYSDVSALPPRRVGVVLGCPMRVFGGWSNPFFENRIEAAAAAYRQGKIEYLIVSGDHHIESYDEPTDMKNALIAKGVPDDRIYLDFAGFRTLDSVVRAKDIFGQDNFTVISQNFHNRRAIFLAQHHGIDAIGLNARDVAPRYAFRILLREQFAQVKAVLDIFVFHTQPHFRGAKIVVGGATPHEA